MQCNINQKGHLDRTLLHFAAELGSEKMIRWLIEKKANINAIDSASKTPLDTFIVHGVPRCWDEKFASERNAWMELLEFFIKNGACVNAKRIILRRSTVTLKTLLSKILWMVLKQEQKNEIILDFLIKNKVNVNLKIVKSTTPLHLAVASGNEKIVRWLIENGAYIHVTNDRLETPLHIAAASGNAKIVRLLIEKGAYIYVTNDRWETPLHYAALSGDKYIAHLLINNGASIHTRNKWNATPLHYAAASGNEDIVFLLLEKGAYANIKTKASNTPLHFVAALGGAQLISYPVVDEGVNINLNDKQSVILPYSVTKLMHERIICLLLDKGVDIDAANDQFETPLYYAVKSGNIGIIGFLLDKGADISIMKQAVIPLDWIIALPESPEKKKLINQYVTDSDIVDMAQGEVDFDNFL